MGIGRRSLALLVVLTLQHILQRRKGTLGMQFGLLLLGGIG
jgi:hypothetical protein